MPSIKNLEMAAAISAYKNIHIQKSFFGLSQKVVYAPTGSVVSVRVNEYAPAEGERLVHLLSLSPGKIESELLAKGKPQPTEVGHFRLEVCLSDDRQFCALQLFRFTDFSYVPVSDPRFFEGEDAQVIARLL